MLNFLVFKLFIITPILSITFKKEKNLKLVYNTLEKEYTHRNIFKKDGKKISGETISEGTKIVYILIDDSQKCINPSLRRKRRKKIFFLISKSSISNVNANLINRRERYDNNEDVCEWSRYADVIKRDITKLEDSWRIQFYYCNAWPSFIKEYKTGNLCTAHGSGIYCAYYINDPRYRF